MELPAKIGMLCVLTLFSCAAQASDTTRTDVAFEKMVETHWKQTLAINPFLAASLGDKSSANQLPDVSLAHQ